MDEMKKKYKILDSEDLEFREQRGMSAEKLTTLGRATGCVNCTEARNKLQMMMKRESLKKLGGGRADQERESQQKLADVRRTE